MDNYNKLLERIKTKKAKVGIIGLGYVGLPLAIIFAQKGFNITGFVRKIKKVKDLNSGYGNLGDVNIDQDLKKVIAERKLTVQLIDDDSLQDQEVLIICVPTPMTKEKQPDITDLKQVALRLSSINLSGKLIINESTVAPFMTREALGQLPGDYFLVCSPERVDPGNKTKTTKDIPKVIGGRGESSAKLAKSLYGHILKSTVVVSSVEAAEMTKMLENSYRAINIALINEFAKLAEKCEIDILEVIKAASTKWSFQAHYPSIGVGGHCIPKDPHYILALAEKMGVSMRALENGLLTNEGMPKYLFNKFLDIYKPGASVFVYGAAYKKNINDLRDSPAIEFCELLLEKDIDFSVYDPFISPAETARLGFKYALPKRADILIVGTDHDDFKKDYLKIIDANTVVIDGRNYFKEKNGSLVLGVGRTLK